MRKKADKKPPVPQKPSNILPVTQKPTPRSSPSTSPPLPRRRNEDTRTPSPLPPAPLTLAPLPPAPLTPASGQRKADETESTNHEYVMLENTSTMDPLGTSQYISCGGFLGVVFFALA